MSTMTEYHAKKEKMFSYLGGACKKCGCTEDLEIDHVDPATKAFTVSSSWGLTWDKLLIELDKCQLLCSGCHKDKSIKEGSLASGWTNKPRQTHGTVWSYNKYKCRCSLCKEAKSISMKKYYRA